MILVNFLTLDKTSQIGYIREHLHKRKLWIVIYHHRFGTDALPIWKNEEPNLGEFAKTLSNFEPNREDEWLELSGPFDIPSF